MKYKDYNDAYKRGDKDIWPGCGILGRCMPCNTIHNFDYKTHINGEWIDNYKCSRNHYDGCPQPHPKPEHDLYKNGNCKKCGFKNKNKVLQIKFSVRYYNPHAQQRQTKEFANRSLMKEFISSLGESLDNDDIEIYKGKFPKRMFFERSSENKIILDDESKYLEDE